MTHVLGRRNNNTIRFIFVFIIRWLQITKKFKARLDERSFAKLKRDLQTLRKY
jgi:hypothetical protein